MAESNLTLTFQQLKDEVGYYLGYGQDSTTYSADQLTQIGKIIGAGLREAYFPARQDGTGRAYEWSWLKPWTTLTTVVGTASYALPDGFSDLMGDLTYPAGDNQHYPVRKIGEGDYRILAGQLNQNMPPQYYALMPTAPFVPGTGQRWTIYLYPTPDAVYTLTYRYVLNPSMLTDMALYHLGGLRYSEMIKESCLAIAEQRDNGELGNHTTKFLQLLSKGIAFDEKQVMQGTLFGNMRDPSMHYPEGDFFYNPIRHWGGTVTYIP